MTYNGGGVDKHVGTDKYLWWAWWAAIRVACAIHACFLCCRRRAVVGSWCVWVGRRGDAALENAGRTGWATLPGRATFLTGTRLPGGRTWLRRGHAFHPPLLVAKPNAVAPRPPVRVCLFRETFSRAAVPACVCSTDHEPCYGPRRTGARAFSFVTWHPRTGNTCVRDPSVLFFFRILLLFSLHNSPEGKKINQNNSQFPFPLTTPSTHPLFEFVGRVCVHVRVW